MTKDAKPKSARDATVRRIIICAAVNCLLIIGVNVVSARRDILRVDGKA